MPRITLLLAALLLAACAARLPLTRTEAASAAQNWCVREGNAWGDPAEVVKPGPADAQGHAWWTVRFPTVAGESRAVRVDADSGWTSRAK
jgi:hypothetical protein